ncbi:MAG TPA: histone deacetylase [Polyangiaceae bacterium]|nr:histone deacetylase [Polyangiaceae bacterium]
MAHALAVVDDPSFDEHRPPADQPEHPECPARLAAARRAVEAIARSVQVIPVPARRATEDELCRVHTPAYIEELGRSAGTWATFDEDTYAAPGSVTAALTAAGGAIELVNALSEGRAERGVALLRPPGHHARPGGAMGFCLVNNVAVAAAHARARGAERVMIVDFDVHHGNGTQESFYADPSVLFVSLHQFPLYPGTGSVGELGSGEGRGHTLNVPLSPGADDAVYAAAFARIVAPLCSEFAPSLVLLSAGFDAHRADPLAQMHLSDAGYGQMVRSLTSALPPNVPIGMVLEGGYDLEALEASLVRTLQSLSGIAAADGPTGAVAGRHAEELARVEAAVRPYFHL